MTNVTQVPECTIISNPVAGADGGPRFWVICSGYQTGPNRSGKSLDTGHRFQSENVGDTRCKS
jgi:hypothetical protein